MTGVRTIEEHTAHWRGVALRIRWEPHWLNTRAAVQAGHLQIESVMPPRVPLPVTKTGYRSWFTSPVLVAEAGGPVAFVLQWLDAEGSGPAWQQADTARQQLSLFG